MNAQQVHRDEAVLHTWIDRVASLHACVGLVVGVIRDVGLQAFAAHGLADIESRTPVTADTGFRIASITKTLTGVAVMQLWEQGQVDLDAPANDYLRALRLVPAAPDHRPPTVRHLLTHSAGIGEVAHPSGIFRPDWGESVAAGDRLPTLAEFYAGTVRLGAEPGRRFVYGNHSPAVLGQLVEDVSGEPFERYVRERIFEPLGMLDSDLRRTPAVMARLATGYEVGGRGPTAVRERDMVTTGAASAYSTPLDMARYAAALLAGGSNEHGSVLEAASVTSMFAPHCQPDARLPGMGLAFFRADLAGHAVVEHQGVHPGFHSQLMLAPDDGVGVIAFTNGAHAPMYWLQAEVRELLRELVGAATDTARDDIPQRPEVWSDIAGWYRLDAGLTDIRLRAMLGAGVEVVIRDGAPSLRFLTPIPELYRGFALRPDDAADPYAYRIDLEQMGTTRVVFRPGSHGAATTLHLELMPLSMARQPAVTNPRRIAAGVLGAVALAGATLVSRRLRSP